VVRIFRELWKCTVALLCRKLNENQLRQTSSEHLQHRKILTNSLTTFLQILTSLRSLLFALRKHLSKHLCLRCFCRSVHQRSIYVQSENTAWRTIKRQKPLCTTKFLCEMNLFKRKFGRAKRAPAQYIHLLEYYVKSTFVAWELCFH
jgi:hypothetical protein